MPLQNFLLTIHVLGAIAIFGVTFAFPFIGALAQKEGAPVVWFLRLTHVLDSKWVTPLSLTIQPASGAWLIINGGWDPFKSEHRWLLASIIIYIVATAVAVFVEGPSGRKALHLAEANNFGPEFGAVMKRIQITGQALTVMLIAIIILMVVKPGSGFIHP
jgi:uncharacterized membrane protein